MNMIQMFRFDRPVSVFFDADHTSGTVNNITVVDDETKKTVTLSAKDRKAIADGVREEIMITIMEADLFRKAGKLMES